MGVTNLSLEERASRITFTLQSGWMDMRASYDLRYVIEAVLLDNSISIRSGTNFWHYLTRNLDALDALSPWLIITDSGKKKIASAKLRKAKEGQ